MPAHPGAGPGVSSRSAMPRAVPEAPR